MGITLAVDVRLPLPHSPFYTALPMSNTRNARILYSKYSSHRRLDQIKPTAAGSSAVIHDQDEARQDETTLD